MKQICQITSAKEAHQLLDSIDHILTDCDGVLYRSKGAIAGSPEAMAKFRSMGKKIIYVTNNSTVSRVKATQRLNEMGFPAHHDQVFPTSFAVADYFKRHAFHGKVSCIKSIFIIPFCNVSTFRSLCWDVRAFGMSYKQHPFLMLEKRSISKQERSSSLMSLLIQQLMHWSLRTIT
jgi:hypothetical protein